MLLGFVAVFAAPLSRDRGQEIFILHGSKKYSGQKKIRIIYIYIYEKNRKEGGRKEGRQAGRKEGRKEYCITIFIYLQNNILHIIKHIYVYTCKYL